MYWSGEGVPRDHKEAARLYLLAANQGYARAQNDIGFMLGFGEGIPPRDDIEAYKWLTLAIKGYTARTRTGWTRPSKDLATLAKRMSPAQITEAERRAKAFKPTPWPQSPSHRLVTKDALASAVISSQTSTP